MATFLEHIATHLGTKIAALTYATNCFYNCMPDSPAECVSVHDAGGDVTPLGPEFPREDHRFEVRIRASTDAKLATLLASVLGVLNFAQGETWNSLLIVHFCRLTVPAAYLETDQEGRIIWLLRFKLQTTRAATY